MGAQADRKSARTTVVALLKASAGVTALVPAASIFDSRTTLTLPTGSRPWINGYTPATDERRAGAPIMFDVTHALMIECFETTPATSDPPADDATLAAKVDDLAEAVQQALFTDPGGSPPSPLTPTFLALYEAVETVRAEIGLEGTGDGRRGLCRLSLEVKHKAQYDPSPMDDLKDVIVDVDMIEDGVAPDGDIDADLDITDLDV